MQAVAGVPRHAWQHCAVQSAREHSLLSQGTKQIKRLEENVGGFELSQRISKADLDELSSFFHMDAAVGERWARCSMQPDIAV